MDAGEAATADNENLQDVDEVDLYGDIGGNAEPAVPGVDSSFTVLVTFRADKLQV